MYDLIGDIHGHATPLKSLLSQMGYFQKAGCYRHPSRRAIFLGDYIDRGPHIREVLEVVRTMVEQGQAIALMGNHEFNAMAFEAGYRENNPKNRAQYSATLDQLREAERHQWIDWFHTLPMWLDLENLRAVHACWNTSAIRQLQAGLTEHGGFTDGFLKEASRNGSTLFSAVETVLKGPEINLPKGVKNIDADGHRRGKARTRWFEPFEGQTWKSYVFSRSGLPEAPLTETPTAVEPYPEDAPPVFFGHYWFTGEQPELLRHNVACLDYSVARGDGFLCGYRWSGEQRLDPANFVRAIDRDHPR